MVTSKVRIIDVALIAITFLLNALTLVIKNITFNEANKLRLTNLISALEGVHDMLSELKIKK